MSNTEMMLDSNDSELAELPVSRRDAIRKGASTGSMLAAGLALGSVPVALAALSRKAVAQPPAAIKAALDFALALEIFENEFFKAVLGISSSAAQNTFFNTVRALIPAAVLPSLQQIQRHEEDHVAFLLAAGATNVFDLNADSFNFSGNRALTTAGPFATAGTNLNVLLATIQLIEDTGVRAYKGQVLELKADPSVLTAALRIHSVEARHAAKIRRVRRQSGGAGTIIRWSGTVSGTGSAAAGLPSGVPSGVTTAATNAYAGEAPTTQFGITVAGLVPTAAPVAAGSEAFDEPLTRAAVITIVQPFFKPTLS